MDQAQFHRGHKAIGLFFDHWKADGLFPHNIMDIAMFYADMIYSINGKPRTEEALIIVNYRAVKVQIPEAETINSDDHYTEFQGGFQEIAFDAGSLLIEGGGGPKNYDYTIKIWPTRMREYAVDQ